MALAVTQKAVETLKGILEEVEHEPAQVLRIVASGDELSLALDAPRTDDQRVDLAGETVTVLDSQLAKRLAGSTLDVSDTTEGPRLTLRRG
jgi:Fe-S cluster assembly iron-binding protein IscA